MDRPRNYPITIEPNPNCGGFLFNCRVVADTTRALTFTEATSTSSSPTAGARLRMPGTCGLVENLLLERRLHREAERCGSPRMLAGADVVAAGKQQRG